MTSVYSKALDKMIDVDRIIGKIEGAREGPTVVFFAGLHGNEPAGVFALNEVINSINQQHVCGSIYAVSGNLRALKEQQRFIDKDLNRMWSQDQLNKLSSMQELKTEDYEQKQIYTWIQHILSENKAPFYFIDIHTTSSKTLPFITINDALINRKFSQNFPVPIVLGIEEYLNGPLLTYLNKKGYVSLGFEAGQHDDKQAITNAISFIYLTLLRSGSIEKKHIADFDLLFKQLQADANHINDVFEVTHLFRLNSESYFKMMPDFKSFQQVNKGQPLAKHNGNTILAPIKAKIFMPLYQNSGKEGFFMIKKIPPIFLGLSAFLRRIKADNLLVLLPGIAWHDKNSGILRANLKTTRFMAKPLFHLLGYRNKEIDKTHVLLFNRERVAKTGVYKDCNWYKSN